MFVLLLTALAAGGTAFYFYKNIKPILVTEINKTLAVKVEVADISISGIKDFPNLGIKFTDVSIDESKKFYGKKLLKAQELNLFIDVLKLYKGEYVIDGVTLRNGQLNVADLKSNTNYNIIQPSSDTSSSAVSFEIKDLSLINCSIHYQHTPSKFKSEAYTPSSSIQLKYEGDVTSLAIKTSLDSTLIVVAEDVFVAKKNLKLNTAIDINSSSERIEISPSDIKIEQVKLKTNGFVTYGKTSEIDIKFANSNTTAQSLLSILPTSITKSMDQIKLNGDVVVDGFFKGRMDGSNDPSFGFNYSLKKTELEIKGQNISLSGIDASGKLEMPNIGNLRNANATCKLTKAQSGNNQLAGDISVTNFTKPSIMWNGKANLAAEFLLALIGNDDTKATAGRIETDGKLSLVYDTDKGELTPNSLRYAGKVLVKGLKASISNPKINVKNLDLDISADNNKMVVNRAAFEYNNTSGTLKGYLDKYQSLLNDKSDATLVGELELDYLNVNDFYSSSDSPQESNSSSNSDIIPINLKLKTKLTDFKYNDFTAESVTGNLISNRAQIGMPKCTINALDGSTIASVSVKKWGNSHLLDISTDIKRVNISKLLKQFNNFEQDEITHEHLSGRLSGSIIAKVILDQNFEPVLPKLYAKANILVENGALVNYEPLKELSSFAKVSDLENVKFKTLKNTIEIFDQTIYIPKMTIANNAMNLTLEGTHTFENYMNYSMSLSVAELLATKAKWIAKKADKRIEKNSAGGLTAYITMEGTPDDLKIKYDRATVKENVKEEVKKEKKKFIKALKGEGTLEEDSAKTKDYDSVWDE